MVQCTAPFIKAETFNKACTKLLENPESTVFAAEEAHYFLWKKSNNNDEDSSWETINHPFNSRVGRQFKKEMQVHETGAFYGFKASFWKVFGLQIEISASRNPPKIHLKY